MWITISDEISKLSGFYPGARPVEELIKCGFLILDKPSGPTSSTCVHWVKKILGIKKAGHSGTLDPRTTGVLPILLGRATRLMPVLKNLDKEYVAVMHLHKNISQTELERVIKKFVGKIEQIPPVRSAVKRKKRERTIYSIKIIDRAEKNVVIKVNCEAGTYIRKLIHQIGEKIDGAHMIELRRTRVGTFTENKSHSFQELKDSFEFWKQNIEKNSIRSIILPPEIAVEHVPKIIVKDSAVFSLVHGSPLYARGILKLEDSVKKGGITAILSGNGELIGIGVAKLSVKDMIKAKSLCVKMDRILMKPTDIPADISP
ncbi:MAG: RNA-guided pseudouridylation complex pseudouridine synthase subunit Cbf5 [Candidatus Aenigmarchaeota archaeon]|nr:RNA-guided pseudouridylation complex pseudouridine synthase subunit Cbf5 [Candidatus Aenigmarchaeota archaeon]